MRFSSLLSVKQRIGQYPIVLGALLCSIVLSARGQPSLAVSNVLLYPTTVYEWSVTKTSPTSSISIQQGTSANADYGVTFTQAASPTVYSVEGQVSITNPDSTQLQFSEIEVQVQYPAGSPNGPFTATVTCPEVNILNGVILINPAVPDSAVSTVSCNFTAELPSSDQGSVTAQAIGITSATLTSQPVGFATDTNDPSVPSLTIGQCAQVNDTFDPLSYQTLGAPSIISGSKPPRDGQTAELICASKTYNYTMQFKVASQAACGSYIVSNTAVVNPVGGSQVTQSATVYLEVNACNSAEVAVPQNEGDQPVADETAPQVDLSITGQSGGGTSFSWGVSNSVDNPTVQLPRNQSTQVTFFTAFTQSEDPQPAAITITGAIVITNPTDEDMEISEVEVSYQSAAANSQQVDTPATCPNSVGGAVLLPAEQSLTCLFTVVYDSQQAGSLWASVVTAAGLTGQSTQLPVETSVPDLTTSAGACAMISASFQSGSTGLVLPTRFAAGSELPPSSSSPQQICNSTSYTYTAVLGPFKACGNMLATSVATLNPVGGQQTTQSAGQSVQITVLC